MSYTLTLIIATILIIAFWVGVERYFIWSYRKFIKELWGDLDEEDN